MKRLILALGISAGALAVSTPASAQTGCRWYDVNCRLATGDVRRTGGTIDSSWHVIGRDANGNTIYERRRIDGNGNVVVERARRDALGRMVIIDRDIDNRNNRVLNSTRYGVNGERCRYQENERGYKTLCKYDRNGNVITTTRRPSERFGAAGTENCHIVSNPAVYKEQCKYVKNKTTGVYRNGVYRNGVDRDEIDRDGVYRTNKVQGNKYKTAKVKSGKYHGENGKGKGHNKD
jgi:hypothetical protein